MLQLRQAIVLLLELLEPVPDQGGFPQPAVGDKLHYVDRLENVLFGQPDSFFPKPVKFVDLRIRLADQQGAGGRRYPCWRKIRLLSPVPRGLGSVCKMTKLAVTCN